jgi:hypothetical protein
VSRIRVPVLIGDGGQDAIWDSAFSATAVVGELRAAHDPGSPPQANALAIEQFWVKMLAFFNDPRQRLN